MVPTKKELERFYAMGDEYYLTPEEWFKIINRKILRHRGILIPGDINVTKNDGKGPLCRVLVFQKYSTHIEPTIEKYFDTDKSAKEIAAKYLSGNNQKSKDHIEGFSMISRDVLENNTFVVAINFLNDGDDIRDRPDKYKLFVYDTELDRWIDLKKTYPKLVIQ